LEAVRDFDAVEIGVNRRFANHFYFDASYTWSRLFGNYAGLASSDENGRTSPNVNRNFVLPFIGFSARGNPDNRRLPTDRPHVVKLYGSYMAPFGTQFGVNFYGGSGTPLSTYVVTTNQTNVFVNGRGDMGRTDPLTRTDLLVSHELKLGGGNKRMRLELNLLNAFNQKTSRHEFNFLNRGAGAPRPPAGGPGGVSPSKPGAGAPGVPRPAAGPPRPDRCPPLATSVPPPAEFDPVYVIWNDAKNCSTFGEPGAMSPPPTWAR
jgi:hypothetical protein